jgi:wyosine [tRNA(Phe)-imidazoG37] synthetase (radical SAM superfamily)
MTDILQRLDARPSDGSGSCDTAAALDNEAAYGFPRDFLNNRYVYVVLSARAGGLCIGVNLNPVVKCSFNCVYCEVDRAQTPRATQFDTAVMARELTETLAFAKSGGLEKLPRYAHLPKNLLRIQHVTVSGDGEPTLSGDFWKTMRTLHEMRKSYSNPEFKLVVVTNSTALDHDDVQTAVRMMHPNDEVWAKLDAGTDPYLKKVNGTDIPLKKILDNILLTAKRRPVTIQSLFPAINGVGPSDTEVQQYALRLKELKEQGARIPLVQIYSATRPTARTGCSHLPLRKLTAIAKAVRDTAALRAEVY